MDHIIISPRVLREEARGIQWLVITGLYHLDGGFYNSDEYFIVEMFNDFQYMIPLFRGRSWNFDGNVMGLSWFVLGFCGNIVMIDIF